MRNYISFGLITIFGGCALQTGRDYRPIVDLKNVDGIKFETDLQECQAYAGQTIGTIESAGVGAIAGATLGVVAAVVSGGRGERASTANLGTLAGAVSGASQGEANQRNIIRRCMSGRGYSVLQ
jgi:outer membrane lipoprotein SlyB